MNPRSKLLCTVSNLLVLNVTTLLAALGGPALGQEWTPERGQRVEKPKPCILEKMDAEQN